MQWHPRPRSRRGGPARRCRGVVAADVCDDGQFAFGFTHDGFQHGLALIDVLIDALTGGAAHIHALDALGNQMAGEGLDALGRNIALCVVAGVKGGDDTLILCNVFHGYIILS